jgi:putative nucleotidyltransferase with HDIG domain
MDTFSRSFLLRCLTLCVLLALAAAGIDFLVEIIKLDRYAESVALAEVQRLKPGLLRGQPPGGSEVQEGEEPVRRLVQEKWAMLRVYDSSGRLRMEALNPTIPLASSSLAAIFRPTAKPGHFRIHRLEVSGRPMVRFQAPLSPSPGQDPWRLEALFLLDTADIRLLRNHVERITWTALAAVLATVLILYPLFHAMDRRLRRSFEMVVRGNLETAMVLGAAIAQRDSDTGSHNARVALYAIRLAEAFGEERVDMIALVLGALLHDVGKIGVPDAVLLKPGRLDPAERIEMETHVQKGLEIIQSSHWLQLAKDVVHFHHERFDGRGYPTRLAGATIPVEARIFAIVDVFDALTSKRPYHPPMAFAEAMAVLNEGNGSHFDPILLAAFRTIAREAHSRMMAASEAELHEALRTEVDRRRSVLFTVEGVRDKVGTRRSAPALIEA